MIHDSYDPTPFDLEWTRTLLFLVNDGGTWALPTTHLVYRIFKTKREILLVNPQQLEEADSMAMHIAVRAVFEKLGYYVAHSPRGASAS